MAKHDGTDRYDENADWLHVQWRWPKYKSRSFFERLEKEGTTLEAFKETQRYLAAVNNGLIREDEWTGLEVHWGDDWLRDGVDLMLQAEYRLMHLRDRITAQISDLQNRAGRGLTKEETGSVILNFIIDSTVDGIDASQVKVGVADISGIDGLRKVDQPSTWFAALRHYSINMVTHLLSMSLPQIWAKQGARAVYYPKRRLIVVPIISEESLPQISHAVAHYVELLGDNLEVIEAHRNRAAYPGTLHLIRAGLYGLRGPWMDQHDGALRGYDPAKLEDWYLARRPFTSAGISNMFTKRPTEYLAMMAQRVARRDPVELADAWVRAQEQLLLYLSVARGHYMEEPDWGEQ